MEQIVISKQKVRSLKVLSHATASEKRTINEMKAVARLKQAMVECVMRLSETEVDRAAAVQSLTARIPTETCTEQLLDQIETSLTNLSWHVSGSISDSFTNIGKIYRQGRRDLRLAQSEPTGHNFHELRKRSKQIYFVFQLFDWAASPPFYKALMQDWKTLSDWLGEHHDLVVLEELLASEPNLLQDEKIHPVLSATKGKLEKSILGLAPLLYWSDDEAFVSLFRQICIASARLSGMSQQ